MTDMAGEPDEVSSKLRERSMTVRWVKPSSDEMLVMRFWRRKREFKFVRDDKGERSVTKLLLRLSNEMSVKLLTNVILEIESPTRLSSTRLVNVASWAKFESGLESSVRYCRLGRFAIFERLLMEFPANDKLVRFEAHSKPVKSAMPAKSAVS